MQLDAAEIAFEATDVLFQGLEQALGMLRGHDHAGAELSLGHAGDDLDEVQDKLRWRMPDDGKIAVGTSCEFVRNLDVELIILVLVVHWDQFLANLCKALGTGQSPHIFV